jgi:hypothetical protein
MPRFDVYKAGTCEQTYELVESGTLVGRDPTADLVLEDPHVSRHHAIIVQQADGLWARNLGGKTPLMINGLPSEEAKLQNGDRIGFGKWTLLFVDDGASLAESSARSSMPAPEDITDTMGLDRREVAKLQYENMQRMRPHLIVRSRPDDGTEPEPEDSGEFFAINCALVSVGADADCVLKLDGLSGRSLLIYRSQLAHRLRVLDESLGITVTGWKVRDAALRDGDMIYAGPYALEYREGVEN